jgi:hypothetical protein
VPVRGILAVQDGQTIGKGCLGRVMGKYRSSTGVFFEKKLLRSKAYRSLRKPTSYFVLGIFMIKRRMINVGRKGKECWVIDNNGEIVFTYEEAKQRYGISYSSFGSAIRELIEKGFLDIAETGMGVHKVKNLYSLGDRWKLYGTPQYEKPKTRPKGPINKGFQKGNQYGRNCKQRKM